MAGEDMKQELENLVRARSRMRVRNARNLGGGAAAGFAGRNFNYLRGETPTFTEANRTAARGELIGQASELEQDFAKKNLDLYSEQLAYIQKELNSKRQAAARLLESTTGAAKQRASLEVKALTEKIDRLDKELDFAKKGDDQSNDRAKGIAKSVQDRVKAQMASPEASALVAQGVEQAMSQPGSESLDPKGIERQIKANLEANLKQRAAHESYTQVLQAVRQGEDPIFAMAVLRTASSQTGVLPDQFPDLAPTLQALQGVAAQATEKIRQEIEGSPGGTYGGALRAPDQGATKTIVPARGGLEGERERAAGRTFGDSRSLRDAIAAKASSVALPGLGGATGGRNVTGVQGASGIGGTQQGATDQGLGSVKDSPTFGLIEKELDRLDTIQTGPPLVRAYNNVQAMPEFRAWKKERGLEGISDELAMKQRIKDHKKERRRDKEILRESNARQRRYGR